MKSGGIAIPVDASSRADLQYSSPYGANKQRRRFALGRSWNRLSKLQRYLIICFLLFIVFLILIKLQSTDTSAENAEGFAPNPRRHVANNADSQHINPEEIVLGEEKAAKNEKGGRYISPDVEGSPDEELGNDSVGGGLGGDGEGDNKVPDHDTKHARGKHGDAEKEGKQEKVDPLERIQEGMVMPRPKIFAGSDNDRQKKVVEAFIHAWDAYKRYAWGHDELKPISRTFKEWFHIGLTLIDALDTMYIMGLTKEFEEAKKWISESLTFEKDVDVNLFEITIRALGGLLSAYHLSGEDVFRQKALDLGDRLTAAFGTDSGVPYSDVNIKTRKAHAPKWGPDSSSAEVTTIQLEFRDLSYVSNDPKYEKFAFRVSEHFHKLEKKDGLIPIFINAVTGQFRAASTITFGARGDSYYEYLLKQWIQDGKRTDWLRADFLDAVTGAQKHIVRTSVPNKLVFIGELLGERFSPKMDALACFFPGTLALAYMNGLPTELLTLAEQIANTCHEMYVRMPTHLAPEITYFKVEGGLEVPPDTVDLHVRDNDAHALLRPEFIESLFYLFRITKNTTYQDWGWDVFNAIEKHAKIKTGGYASIQDVRKADNVEHRDHMESFLLGETFKYLYLLLGTDQTQLPLDEYVFNTEAHPLPIRKG
ncbi:endoplasmic reticulum mannosyl-oligosaccharide 1,2-alpha-mannosidase-like [Paramacrobiotus metropolitanus]|uniref:endoplasmic reticulum mannosyl-oligosaccharide 1,2-alpha-mannosidase-like n=1 Tax=Paramacrobiotus metropolitanus TaxID=2943436 RepID=UPI0024458A4F|nr:endoplasmic reticulum mannosyl-oligosaccharide 1,2-alpha-mannosidase-like [Paramacrobiotus metropolitanus]